MSQPRPFHSPHREIRSTPDASEPQNSYEGEPSPWLDHDDFHTRLRQRKAARDPKSTSSLSGSFWRNTSSQASRTTTGSLGNSNHQRGTSSQSNQYPNGNDQASSVSSTMSPEERFQERLLMARANRDQSLPSNVILANTRSTTGTSIAASASPSPSNSKINGNGNKIQTSPSSFVEEFTVNQQKYQQRYQHQDHSNGRSSHHSQDNLPDIMPPDISINPLYRKESTSSLASNSSRKKDRTRQRNADRKLKLQAQTNNDFGNDQQSIEETSASPSHSTHTFLMGTTSRPLFENMPGTSSLDRATSDQSSGSHLYGKMTSSGHMLGKSSSLIFPTNMEGMRNDSSQDHAKWLKVNLLLDQCESTRFPFKSKKLILNNLGLSAADVPVTDLCGTHLGKTLHKLSLAANPLHNVPAALVQQLVALKHLDLSQCELSQLPSKWDLPQLRRLNLSHNRLRDFPEEGMLKGLPELQELNMYGNKVQEIVMPRNNAQVLQKLETLNLGYNDLAYLPDDLDQLRNLKTLKVMNNLLSKVPMRICDMDLRVIDVSSNPVIQPPIETCERGIGSMKRYYHCLRMEEQQKQSNMDQELLNTKKIKPKKKSYGIFTKTLGKPVKSPSSPYLGDGAHSTSGAPILSHNTLLDFGNRSSFGQLTLNRAHTDNSALTMGTTGSGTNKSTKSLPTMNQTALQAQTSDQTIESQVELRDQVTINDTLKVIFVGMAMVGKTSMIKRLIEGEDAVVPTYDERTVGVDIYEWEPKLEKRFEHIDSRIEILDEELRNSCGDVDVKLSVWDFAGQHVYHATHELFFSPTALYVLVWDMGATNPKTHRRQGSGFGDTGAFSLSYDSSSDEENDLVDPINLTYGIEEENRRVDRELEHDIDEKVQFWVDCIQSSAPGAAILPVASFDDYFMKKEGGNAEAIRRCNMLRQRLLRHEMKRLQGLKERLQDFKNQKRETDPAALRLRTLLCSYQRPKLIFGDDDCGVVRVSGTKYTGFATLTEKIIAIATGRDRGSGKYPIFHGHVGARIPRMRLEVRAAVREMRDRFKVVEWGYFINILRSRGLNNVEDISDALHFLTKIGEVSYFGCIVSPEQDTNPRKGGQRESYTLNVDSGMRMDANEEDDAEVGDDSGDDKEAILSMDDTNITAPSTINGSVTTADGFLPSYLSQFVFLNPRWLVAAVACILRHDLDREIRETRRLTNSNARSPLVRNFSFDDAQLNCPVITASDALMLWQAKKITKKAAARALQYSDSMTMTPFEFLQLLLVRFGVFVPIDLDADKALLGGQEFSLAAHKEESPDDQSENQQNETLFTPNAGSDQVSHAEESALKAQFFFLPSLLGPGEPAEAWTYKTTDSWKTTLCHSILFPDGVPPGLMERLTAGVLSAIYAISNHDNKSKSSHISSTSYEGTIRVKEILCWRMAFFLKLGTQVLQPDGSMKESVVEIFTLLADRENELCVGSDHMGVGTRRLIISGRGQVGDNARKIWKGGYLLVIKCARHVVEAYGGVEYQNQAFCPECLAKKAVSEASCWNMPLVRNAVEAGEYELRCHNHGHRVHTALVAGPIAPVHRLTRQPRQPDFGNEGTVVQNLFGAVVIVGLWDEKARHVVRAGSGFIVDRKHGLIVTAAHTLINIDDNDKFGEDYYGLRHGKVVIGVIPRENETDTVSGKESAIFRYYAKVVAKDPAMMHGECHVDACVLRITTRMENDVDGDGQACADQPERLLLNDPVAMRNERLKSLKLTDKYELDEQVRIIGYNQGGEGRLRPGNSLCRYIDFSRGYVSRFFAGGGDEGNTSPSGPRFKPKKELVVNCHTIIGHSGGPCVNQQGEVIGILSRADPAENQRCYISPTSEWQELVRRARRII